MGFQVPRIEHQTGRRKAPTPEKSTMFQSVTSPFAEGIWSRVAPYLALLAILASFCLAFTVVVSAIETGQYIATHVPKDSPSEERPVVAPEGVDVAFIR
jgi:hypothetical protein